MKSLEINRESATRIFRDILNYPILVPDLGSEVNELLIAGDICRYADSLRRLSRLDFWPATALLGYFHLCGVFTGKPDTRAAKELCMSPASAGDAYCQFVFAWGCKIAAAEDEAVAWLRRSAESGFSPSCLDLGRWIEVGIGVPAPDSRQARRLMWKAHRMGHRAGLLAIARSLFEEKNLILKVVGCAIWPFGLIRMILYARRYPFREFVFGHSSTRTLPLFKQDSIRFNGDAVASGAPVAKPPGRID